MKKILLMLIICIICFILTSCESDKEVTSSNYSDYFSINTKLSTVQRADGTSVGNKLYDDSRVILTVYITPNSNVEIKNIDFVINVTFKITYFEYINAVGNKIRNKNETVSYSGTFNNYVDSYKFTFTCPKMYTCYINSKSFEVSGVVSV